MKLVELLRDVSVRAWRGSPEIEVCGEVREDSRLVQPGDIFVAVPGREHDGHAFVADAEAQGAAALVAERDVPFEGPVAIVENSRLALALAAANLLGRPATSLELCAVTGTNGKTTTSWLLEAMLVAAGARPGLIGTIAYRAGGVSEPAPLTTPGPLKLQALFGRLREAHCTHAVLEVSSHALALDRLAGLEFVVAGFSNLTRDHLDYHRTMDDYRAAKARLFSERLGPDGVAVVNVDAADAEVMAKAAAPRRLMRCSAMGAPMADVRVVRAQCTLAGITTELETPLGRLALESPLLGRFNLDNLVLATAMAGALGIEPSAIVRGAAALPGVPGRLELVSEGNGVSMFTDYAHTPDALDRVVGALRDLGPRRLIVVFGCGGDRDRSKRPLMGRIAAAGADHVIVTSDNPRSENPLAIIEEILSGMSPKERMRCTVSPDRKEAIFEALRRASAGDAVLVAGKGHEAYQIVGSNRLRFDDREELFAAATRLAAERSRTAQSFGEAPHAP